MSAAEVLAYALQAADAEVLDSLTLGSTAAIPGYSVLAEKALEAFKAAGYEVIPRTRLVDTVIMSGLLSVSFLQQGADVVFPAVEKVVDTAAGETQ